MTSLIAFELFLVLIINSLILYTINKKQDDPTFTIQEKVKDEVKTFKKAWVKKDKYKPYVNDDYKAWVKENSKA